MKSKVDLNLLKLFGTEFDLYNITNIVRGKFWNLNEQSLHDLLVSHISGNSDELLSKMISAENLKSSFMELSKTKFSEIIPSEADDIVMMNEFDRKSDLFLYNSLLREFTNMFKLSTVVSVVRLYDYGIINLSSISYAVENTISSNIVVSKIITSE
nr:V-type ATPase subunit [Nitrosopumilus sp. Nsub]